MQPGTRRIRTHQKNGDGQPLRPSLSKDLDGLGEPNAVVQRDLKEPHRSAFQRIPFRASGNSHRIAVLNGWPVRDGVAERHAQLDDVRSSFLHAQQNRHGIVDGGETSCYERNESRNALQRNSKVSTTKLFPPSERFQLEKRTSFLLLAKVCFKASIFRVQVVFQGQRGQRE